MAGGGNVCREGERTFLDNAELRSPLITSLSVCCNLWDPTWGEAASELHKCVSVSVSVQEAETHRREQKYFRNFSHLPVAPGKTVLDTCTDKSCGQYC